MVLLIPRIFVSGRKVGCIYHYGIAGSTCLIQEFIDVVSDPCISLQGRIRCEGEGERNVQTKVVGGGRGWSEVLFCRETDKTGTGAGAGAEARASTDLHMHNVGRGEKTILHVLFIPKFPRDPADLNVHC